MVVCLYFFDYLLEMNWAPLIIVTVIVRVYKYTEKRKKGEKMNRERGNKK